MASVPGRIFTACACPASEQTSLLITKWERMRGGFFVVRIADSQHVARILYQSMLKTPSGADERPARSRAKRMPSSAPSMLLYGLPGAHHRPSNGSNRSFPRRSTARVGSQEISTVAAQTAAACSRAESVAMREGWFVSKSPMIPIFNGRFIFSFPSRRQTNLFRLPISPA